MNDTLFTKLNIKNFVIYMISAILILIVFLQVRTHTNNSYDIFSINNNWAVEKDGEYSYQNLPLKLKSGKKGNIRIIKRLPKNIDVDTLNIFTVDQILEVSINGKIIFSENTTYPDKSFIKVSGKKWNQIPIHDVEAGSIIMISLKNESNSDNMVIHGVYLSRGADFSKKIIRENALSFIICIVFFMIGSSSYLSYRYLKTRVNDTEFLNFFAWIMIIASIWLTSENQIVKFFFPYPSLLSFIRAIALMLLPLTLTSYLMFVDGIKDRKTLKYLALLLKYNFIFRLILAFFGIYSISSIDRLISLMIYLALISIVIIIFTSMYRGFTKRTIVIEISFMLLFAFLITDNYMLHDNQAGYNNLYAEIGLLIFFFSQMTTLSNKFKKIFNTLQVTEKYKNLAKTDIMTSLNNRFSFEDNLKKIDKIIDNDPSKLKSKNFSILMVDLNNLKPINDNLGHTYGDDALSRCANAIKMAFQGSGINFGGTGRAFRIGGDEFAVIFFGIDEGLMNEKIDYFKSIIDEKNEELIYCLSAAVGYAFYDEKIDKSAEDVYKRADKNMYQNKIIMKGGNVR